MFNNLQWNKIGAWFTAFILTAQVQYPGLDGDTIWHAMQTGAIWPALVNIFMILFTSRVATLVDRKKRS